MAEKGNEPAQEPAKEAGKEREKQYLESLVGNLTGWGDAEKRLKQAFRLDEFILFGQRIVPLDPNSGLPPRLEVLVRMREEEKTLTPPGAFIPFLEYYGMMPALDRWVVDHALQWWRSQSAGNAPALNINLYVETMLDPSFAAYVAEEMRKVGMPGKALCFEVEAMDIASHAREAKAAAEALMATGCGIAISGFGRDLVSFGALKMVAAGMIKLDGALVLNFFRDPVAAAKIKSVQGVCTTTGIQTIAEFVEQQETMRKLREIGVNYAQGYGVARPEALG